MIVKRPGGDLRGVFVLAVLRRQLAMMSKMMPLAMAASR